MFWCDIIIAQLTRKTSNPQHVSERFSLSACSAASART